MKGFTKKIIEILDEINTHGILIKKLGKIENILDKYLPKFPLFEKSVGEDENWVENNEHLSIPKRGMGMPMCEPRSSWASPVLEHLQFWKIRHLPCVCPDQLVRVFTTI